MLAVTLAAGGEQAAAQTIELNGTKLDLARVGVEGDGDANTITAQAKFTADTLSLAQTGPQPAEVNLTSPGVDIHDLSLRIGPNSTQVKTSLSASASAAKATQHAPSAQPGGKTGSGDAANLAAEAIALDVNDLGLTAAPSATSVSGAANLTAESIDLACRRSPCSRRCTRRA